MGNICGSPSRENAADTGNIQDHKDQMKKVCFAILSPFNKYEKTNIYLHPIE